MINISRTFAILFLSFLFFHLISCKKEPIVDPNEGELITTVKVKLTDLLQGSSSVKEFVFQDLDGEGGVAPQRLDQIIVSKGRSYKCEVELLNESVNPVDQVTEEVLKEGVDHQLYFTATPSGLTSFTYGDKDANGLPIGITTFWNTGSNAGSGTLNITLKHKPGIKKPDDAMVVGDTDLSIDFKFTVQ